MSTGAGSIDTKSNPPPSRGTSEARSRLPSITRPRLYSASGIGWRFHVNGSGTWLSEISWRCCSLSKSCISRANRASVARTPKPLVTSNESTSCTRSQERKTTQLIGQLAETMCSTLDTGIGAISSLASCSPWRGMKVMFGV